MSTPLVDWLRAQDDATLAALVRLRPDLTVPPPADLTVLATRAGVRASVHRACDDLDTPTLAVLEALVVADADSAPVARAEVARLLGPDMPADRPRRGPRHPARPRPHLGRGVSRGRHADTGQLSRSGGRPSTERAWRGDGDTWAAGRRAHDRLLARPGRAGRRAAVPRRAGPPGGRARGIVRAAAAARRASTPTSDACSTRSPPVRRSAAAGPRPTPAGRSGGCSRRACCCASTRRPSSCPARSGSPCAATVRWARSRSPRRSLDVRDRDATTSTAPRAAPRWSCCAASRR